MAKLADLFRQAVRISCVFIEICRFAGPAPKSDHMNGRVQDAITGRFLSADPLIKVGSTQGLNRYSYVMNNPMSWVDPSGFQRGNNLGGYSPVYEIQEIITTARRDQEWSPPQVPLSWLMAPPALSSVNGAFGPSEFGGGNTGPVSHAEPGEEPNTVSLVLMRVSSSARNWLCRKDDEDETREALGAVDDALTAADATKLIAAAGATLSAAGALPQPYSTVMSNLGRLTTDAVENLGAVSRAVSVAGVSLSALSGDVQGALYSGLDALVYTGLAAAGTAGSTVTLGESAFMAASTMTLYYSRGGSEGLIQDGLGCR